jgi:exodeoxyribonuclease-3
MKIISWNIHGLDHHFDLFRRVWDEEQPDVFALQNTGCGPAQVPYLWEGFEEHWNMTEDYVLPYETWARYDPERAGNLLISRYNALQLGHDADTVDLTGHSVRTLFLPTNYVQGRDWGTELLLFFSFATPLLGRSTEEALRRAVWDNALLEQLFKPQRNEPGYPPALVCGDFRLTPTDGDIASDFPGSKRALSSPASRMMFQRFLDKGYVDVFRHFQSGPGHYTAWPRGRMYAAKRSNKGARTSMFLANTRLLPHITRCWVLDHIDGTYNCPIGLEIDLPNVGAARPRPRPDPNPEDPSPPDPPPVDTWPPESTGGDLPSETTPPDTAPYLWQPPSNWVNPYVP